MTADGSIIIETEIDDKKAQQELNRLNRRIQNLNDQIYVKRQQQMPLVEQARQLGAELDAAKAKLDSMQSGREFNTSSSIDTQAQRVKQLEKEWSDVQRRVESYDDQIQKANISLGLAKEQAGAVQQQLAAAGPSSKAMADAMDRMGKSAHRFSMRLREVVRSALVFTVISQGLASLREWLGKVIRSNDEATAAIARLKGALLTLAQPLITVVIPAFVSVVNILTKIVSVIAQLFAMLFGTTIEQSKEAAEQLYGEADAIEGVGAAASEAAGALAGFDEINTITTKNAGSATGGLSSILPDFSALQDLPKSLKDILADMEIKIQEIGFSWDKGEILQNKDAWIVFLSGILGAIIGSMFGGLAGGVIGLLLGLSIGLISCSFLDKTSNPELYKSLFIVALGAILGAILGGMFGGITGAVIGLLLGALITITALEFAKGDASTWDPKNTVIVVLSAIIGAILGSVFGGIAGGVIGFLLGALISFVAIEFSEGNFNKDNAIASLRIALFAILGLVLGTMFGGLTGGVIGLVVGLTFGFASVAFDKELASGARAAATKALKVAITTIIGALIGAVFGGGIFGGIVGGVIGLTFGLAITFGDAKIRGGGFGSTSSGSFGGRSVPSIQSFSIPALATGSVIPPNREFLAVLGDNKKETEVVSPLSTMKQAVLEAMRESGMTDGTITVVVNLDGKEVARNSVKHINNMTRQAGRSVLLI